MHDSLIMNHCIPPHVLSCVEGNEEVEDYVVSPCLNYTAIISTSIEWIVFKLGVWFYVVGVQVVCDFCTWVISMFCFVEISFGLSYVQHDNTCNFMLSCVLYFAVFAYCMCIISAKPITTEDFFLDKEGAYTLQQAYKNSKLCNVLTTLTLAKQLDGTGVTCNCVCPGKQS